MSTQNADDRISDLVHQMQDPCGVKAYGMVKTKLVDYFGCEH